MPYRLTSSLPGFKRMLRSPVAPEPNADVFQKHGHTDETESVSSDFLQRKSKVEVDCLNEMKEYCKAKKYDFSDATIFRFAVFHHFHFDRVRKALRENEDNHYLNLSMKESLRKQLETQFIFPLPNMKTKRGDSDVFYMRPSNYIPGFGGLSCVFENLGYVLNDMSRTKNQCLQGVGLVVNMIGFERENFDMDYWQQLMQMLEGKLVPTRVKLVLFVNAPTWFSSKIWKLTKAILSDSFSKNAHLIHSSELSHYLMDGYVSLLPDEVDGGWKSTDEIVEDYIDMRTYQDNINLSTLPMESSVKLRPQIVNINEF